MNTNRSTEFSVDEGAPPVDDVVKSAVGRTRPPSAALHGDSTVAFLFVSGAQDFLEDVADTAQVGGARAALLRSCVAKYGGWELDATVTSFPAAFASPSAALACARGMLALIGDLRAGIHCGEPVTIEEGRYFGAAVWIAARLSGRAQPGRVLVSAAAAGLLPPETRHELREVDPVRLKGIADAVPVWIDSPPRTESAASPAGQRVLTVLAVDQVGSTAVLDERGDAAAAVVHAALMDVVREAVEEYHGIEIEYGGDGVTAGFDSALAAVSCAAELQQTAARHRRRFTDSPLVMRAALVSGEADPTRPASLNRLLTDVERLAKTARGGEVLVSMATSALARDRRTFEFSSDPERSANLLEWRPEERDRRLPEALAQHGMFVGRTQEKALLRRQWSRTVDDGEQRVLVMEGAVGSGKTALAAQLAQEVASEAIVLYGRCAELEVRPLEALVAALTATVEAASRADLRRLVGPHSAILGQLFSGVRDRLAGDPSARIEGNTDHIDAAEALDGVLSALCDEAPVLLVLDDLQNASLPILAALRRIMEARSGRTMMLLALHRTTKGSPSPIESVWRDARAAGSTIESHLLSPLSDDEVTDLIVALTGAPLNPADHDAVKATRGLPIRAHALAHDLLTASARSEAHDAFAEVDQKGPDPSRLRRLAGQVLQLERLRQDRNTDGESASDVVGDGGRTPPTAAVNPYRGLASFDAADAGWFFGREQLTAELVAAVAAYRVVAVVGASGSGKSSLVRAGLVPALARDSLPGSRTWHVSTIVPGKAPIDALADALDVDCGVLRERGFARAAAAHPAGVRRVILVDQAEELFTTASDDDRDRFVQILEEAITTRTSPVSVVLVMRAEFYGRWAAYPEIAGPIEQGHLLLRAMTDTEVRRAIEAPAARAGLILEPALVDAVVADVSGEPGSLPLLSAAMSETWERRRGRSLTLRGYAETGGVRRAVARMADAVYSGFDDNSKAVARRLLLRLTQAGPNGSADDLRRRAPLEEIRSIAPDAEAVMRAFVDQRLLTADDSTVEVAHEALLREWPQLREWLDDDRAGRILMQAVANDALVWREHGKDPSLLYRGSRLALAVEHETEDPGAFTSAEHDFVEASNAAATGELTRAQRAARRFRRLTVGLVVVLVGALIAAGFAVAQGRVASAKVVEARAAALAAQSGSLLDSQQDLGGLLALAAEQLHPSPQAAAAVLTAANRSPAVVKTMHFGGGDAVMAAMSADGRFAAVLDDGAATEYNLATRRAVAQLPGSWVENAFLALSPTGRFLAGIGSNDFNGIVVFDRSTGQTSHLPAGSNPTFLTDAVMTWLDSRGSQQLADPRTGRRAAGVVGRGTIAASRDGRVLAWSPVNVTTGSGGAKDFRATGTRLFDLGGIREAGPPVTGSLVGLSDDGSRVAVYRAPNVLILDRVTRRVIRVVDVGSALSELQLGFLAGNEADARPIGAFDASGDAFAFQEVNTNDDLHLVDVRTGLQHSIAVPFNPALQRPTFDSAGHLLLRTANGIAVFAVPADAPAPELDSRAPRTEFSPSPRTFLAVDPDGGRILQVVPGSGDATPAEIRIRSGDPLGSGPVIEAAGGRRFVGTATAFSPDGRRVATLERDIASGGRSTSGVLSVWDAATGKKVSEVGPFASDPSAIQAPSLDRVAFVGDSGTVAVLSGTGRAGSTGEVRAELRVWTMNGGPEPRAAVLLGSSRRASFSPDGLRLAILGHESLTIWTVPTGRKESSLSVTDLGTAAYSTLRFTSDGSDVYAGSSLGSRSVVRWQIDPLREESSVQIPPIGGDHSWAVSPDGRTLADLAVAGIEYRSLDNGALLSSIKSASGVYQLLSFTADGSGVIGWDGRRLDLIEASGETLPLGPAGEPAASDVIQDDPDVVATHKGLLAAVTSDRRVIQTGFSTTLAEAERRICQIAARPLTTDEWSQYVPDRPYERLCSN